MKSDAKIIRQMASELKLEYVFLTLPERLLLDRVQDEMIRWGFIDD